MTFNNKKSNFVGIPDFEKQARNSTKIRKLLKGDKK